MSFLDELKRRNVFRVGIAYAVSAWVILQVLDVVGEILALPAWGGKLILTIIVVGFFLALFFAWAFELTPDGIKRESEVDRSQSITPQTGRKLNNVILVLMALAITYLLFDKFYLSPQLNSVKEQQAGQVTAQQTVAPPPAATPEINPHSIAVLPFSNMSGDPENEYFSDGLTETLLHMLAQLPDLRVAARTSSFAFKGRNPTIDEVAEALGVAHILEGSVQKSGDRVRITAQLIRADDGFHVWSQNYTRPLEDIFTIQDEIAANVAQALDATLLGKQPGAMHGVETTSLTAYDSYLRGIEQQAIFSYSGLEIAENHFKQALARDPGFTEARLALVRNYILMEATGLISSDQLQQSTDPLIQQVQQRQPGNPQARAYDLAVATAVPQNFTEEQLRVKLDEIRSLLTLIPTDTFLRWRISRQIHEDLGEYDTSIEILQAGLLIDPLAAELHEELGHTYLEMGVEAEHITEARRALERALELAPNRPGIYDNFSRLEEEIGDLTAAMEWHRLATEVDPQDHELAESIANHLYDMRLPEEAEPWQARIQALAPGSAVARKVALEAAWSQGQFDRSLELAESMILDQVETRRNSFWVAVTRYTDLMLRQNRAEEGYQRLVAMRPEIANYAIAPPDLQGILMQWGGVILMAGFEPPERVRDTWLQVVPNLDQAIPRWRDPTRVGFMWFAILSGNYEDAINYALEQWLTRPAWHLSFLNQRAFPTLLGVIYDDPRVATKLVERDRQFDELRTQVALQMMQPEWQQ